MVYLAVTAIVCVAIYKWFKWRYTAAMLAAWMAENKYLPPDEKEMKRLSVQVAKKWLKFN